MERCICLLFLLLVTRQLQAQIPIQVFAGNQAIEFNFMWNGFLDKQQKVNLFNFTFFEVDYEDQENNTYEIYQFVTYNFSRQWGLAGGGRFTANEFIPEVALSFQVEQPDLYVNLFPSLRYTPSREELGYSLFGMMIFNPSIGKNWSLFNQMIFESVLDKNGHVFSYQQIRLGFGYKLAFQFGLGANLAQTGSRFKNSTNAGIFLRKEL